MVRHLVMFRLQDVEAAAGAKADFKTKIEELPAIIPELASVQVLVNDGLAQGNWTLGLIADCKNYADLDVYSKHPAHLACVAIIKPYIEQRACVDAEI